MIGPLTRTVWTGLALAAGFALFGSAAAGQYELFSYEVVGDTITITDYPTSAAGEVVVPAFIDGLPVTAIGDNAFFWCAELTGITLPDSVISIGENAFSLCAKLTSVNLPDGVITLGDDAFYYCTRLTSVTIPRQVRRIGRSTFYACRSLTSILIPDQVTSIGVYAFHGCSGLTSVTIPDAVTDIGRRAFASCHELETIVIPANVASIGLSAFSSCTGMEAILVSPDNNAYASVGGVLFDAEKSTLIQCPAGLAGAYSIPDGVETIGADAFGNCHSLTTITIPSGVTVLEGGAFFHCSSLTDLILPPGIITLGDGAFVGCRTLTTMTIPASVTSIGFGVWSRCAALSAVLVDDGNSAYSSRDGVLFDAAGSTLLQVPPGRGGFYSIPDGVSIVAEDAFQSCRELAGITIQEGVTTIGDRAFEACSGIAHVTIPSTVTSIGSSAFYSCSNLKSVLFLGDAPGLGSGVFRNGPRDFVIYFLAANSGFPSPTWDGELTVPIDLGSHPAAPWLLTHGLPYDSDLALDLNGDGVPLLMAYALDLDPLRNLAGSLPAPKRENDRVSFSFHAATPGINYRVETSTDLRTWVTDGISLSELDSANHRTASIPTDASHRFLRLVVTHAF